tara:strand:+ start:363 stop:797 length:435 start_codon:yes stop_codon:yes gene_type:complete
MAYKGRYKPKRPEKYIGNPTNVIYRSLLERRFMVYCDRYSSILEWGSEEVIVPYKSPVDNRMHRYFVDFLVKLKNKNGITETLLIEVKPKKQCLAPKKPKKKTRTYLNEIKTWGINSAKWKAATEYAENKGWKFIIITDETLAP